MAVQISSRRYAAMLPDFADHQAGNGARQEHHERNRIQPSGELKTMAANPNLSI